MVNRGESAVGKSGAYGGCCEREEEVEDFEEFAFKKAWKHTSLVCRTSNRLSVKMCLSTSSGGNCDGSRFPASEVGDDGEGDEREEVGGGVEEENALSTPPPMGRLLLRKREEDLAALFKVERNSLYTCTPGRRSGMETTGR